MSGKNKVINWSDISNQSIIGRALRLPLKVVPKNAKVSIQQGVCRGMKWIVGSGNHGYWLGSYELTKQLALERYVKTGMTVYDIGAHAGFYTLFFSRLVGKEGRVFAFEPYPENLDYLIKHVRLNKIANVTIVALAISLKDGLGEFVTCTSSSTGRVTDRQTDRQTDMLVPTMSLDSLVERHGFPVPDLIKLDVEGLEVLVFRGASKVLRGHKPTLFVSLHGEEEKQKSYQFLRAHGYRVTSLEGNPQALKILEDKIIAIPEGHLSE